MNISSYSYHMLTDIQNKQPKIRLPVFSNLHIDHFAYRFRKHIKIFLRIFDLP